MRNWFARLWVKFKRWWVKPFPVRPGPDQGMQRAIPIELGFWLHADGKVYHRPRDMSGDRRIDNGEIVGMVHGEYKLLTIMARRKLRARTVLRTLIGRKA